MDTDCFEGDIHSSCPTNAERGDQKTDALSFKELASALRTQVSELDERVISLEKACNSLERELRASREAENRAIADLAAQQTEAAKALARSSRKLGNRGLVWRRYIQMTKYYPIRH